ncbi:MAG TPA: response regulator transcription factor [Flavilitoribacter sp.]|nr:response regulator transcription factor [Flavilitoribacter sp.]
MINLAIIDDQPLVIDTLIQFLSAQEDIKVIHTANSVESFLETHKTKTGINVILLDIGLPGGMSGIEGIRHIRPELPDADIIMLTAHDDNERIFEALRAGAVAYIKKTSNLQEIREALMTVHNGGSYMSPAIARKIVAFFGPKYIDPDQALTPRQEEIVQGLVDGLSYKLIADKLDISVETVRDHIKKIYKKLNVNSKGEVIKKKMDGEI